MNEKWLENKKVRKGERKKNYQRESVDDDKNRNDIYQSNTCIKELRI